MNLMGCLQAEHNIQMVHERETLVGALGRRGVTGLETGCLGSQPLRRAWRSRMFCRPPRAGPPGQRWDGTAVCLGEYSDHKGPGWPETHFSGKAIGGRLFFFFLLWRVLQGADATERAIGMWVSGWQGRQFWEEGKGQCAAGQADGWEGTGKGCVSGWIQGALGPRGGR